MRNNKFSVQKILVALLATGASALQAANIAIIDSGVDYKHEAYESRMWTNPNGSTTAGGITYRGDTHGWNFADNNNQVIDYKYLGTFSADCYKIFEIQGKILRGTATDEEKKWYASKKNDANFLKELQKFGNFVHGTHVAGVSAEQSNDAAVMALKIIPTEVPGSKDLATLKDKFGNPMVSMMLKMVAKRQADMLTKVSQYTSALHANVANGSFGVSVPAVKPTVANLVKQITGQEPTEAETEQYARELVNEILAACKPFLTSAPDTLFVLAAGNDGLNNDQSPVSPANIDGDNKIVVAATLGAEKIATFSNYGMKVDVAAPGVVIRSSIPGNQYLEMSGTSMAAPFVTNVAGRVKDSNRDLSVAHIKKILCETVDVKPWLQGKVRTSGIVNAQRATAAAELSRKMSLEQAIAQAKIQVADQTEVSDLDVNSESSLLVMPLPSSLR